MADTYTRPTLTDGIVTLRKPQTADVDARLAAGNDADIHYMYGVPKGAVQPITHTQAERWVTNKKADLYGWCIDVSGTLIGGLRLHSVVAHDRRATLAIGLFRKSDLGQGHGTRALRLALVEAFGALKLHRISLRVLSYNARAIAAYQKVGFVTEGRERQSARVGDTWHDDVMMGLLAPDWRAAA